jgi:NADH-quinone oxidoreductase subunit J
VLFLFVVMMLDINIAELRAGFVRNAPVAMIVAAVMVVELVIVVGPQRFGLDAFAPPAPKPAGYSNTEELGLALFTEHLYAFEIAAVILLVGIIAAISLTMRRRADTKYQDPGRQVTVKASDRIRVVKMDPED